MGIFGGLTVEENMRLATHDGSFDRDRLGRIYALFPALETFWTEIRLVALRRPETDAGDRPGDHRKA